MEKIRVLIIDEHPAVCQALVVRLSAVSSIEVVGSASTYREGLKGSQIFQPDVILLELKGTGENDIEPLDAVSGLLAGGPAGVIVLTSYLDESERAGALEAGALRYLLKEIDTTHLVGEIEAVADEASLGFPAGQVLPEKSSAASGNRL
jgi:DNA-binding NarL/FixJ family response regulator